MKQIFINLPVKDVEASMGFYKELGFMVNPLFTFEDQKCMVWSEQVYVMLQAMSFFGNHTDQKIADTKRYLAATFTLPVESLVRVNEMVNKGLEAGGTEPTPMVDEGFLQVRTIQDLDGHSWGIMYLDMKKFKEMKNR